MQMLTSGLLTSLTAYGIVSLFQVQVYGIGCFVCTSINGSEPHCEDTFNNTSTFYEPICKAGRKGRSGLFPGTQCVKVKAERDGYTVLVRKCVVDDGGINSDTEMGRESHCWMVNLIKFNDRQMYGCSLACITDGCNGASVVTTNVHFLIVAIAFVAIITAEEFPFS